MGFVDGPVTVSVPATSANLGPGFDSLGLALDLRDHLEAEVGGRGLVVEVEGQGAGDVPRDERHLVVQSMRAGFERLGQAPAGLRLHCRNVIPHARGLGSSSAAIVGGLVLARALVSGGTLLLDDDDLLALASELEGHPDNVAPALLGGFTVAGVQDGRAWALRMDVDPRVVALVFVPPTGVRTETARGLLPAEVPHADAAHNAARAALLVAALTGAPDRLTTATEDRLHQSYRRPAMPATLDLVTDLRRDGVAAVVSGAGPTVLALTDATTAPGLLRRAPDGWSAQRLDVDRSGARVLAS